MYGCVLGTIFSKLAFTRKWIACQPRNSVATKDTSNSATRLLKMMRSSHVPLARSNSLMSRTTGLAILLSISTFMTSNSLGVDGLNAAQACQYSLVAFGEGDIGDETWPRNSYRLERVALVATHDQMTILRHE